MNTFTLSYYDVDDYDMDALYDTIMVLDEVFDHEDFDDAVRELFFAGFFLKKADDQIKVWRFCRMMWSYGYSDDINDKILTVSTLHESIINYMETGFVVVQKDHISIDKAFKPIVEYLPRNQV